MIWEPITLIFGGYNPNIEGLKFKTFMDFMVLGSKGGIIIVAKTIQGNTYIV